MLAINSVFKSWHVRRFGFLEQLTRVGYEQQWLVVPKGNNNLTLIENKLTKFQWISI